MAISSQSTPRLLISQVGILASLEKTIPMGQLCMCAFQWYQEKKNWQYLQSLVVRIPVSNPSEKAFSVVENAKKKKKKSITVSGFGQFKNVYITFQCHTTEGSVFSP